MKHVNNFQIAKVQPQGVAYQLHDLLLISVWCYLQKKSAYSLNSMKINYNAFAFSQKQKMWKKERRHEKVTVLLNDRSSRLWRLFICCKTKFLFVCCCCCFFKCTLFAEKRNFFTMRNINENVKNIYLIWQIYFYTENAFVTNKK